MYMLLQILLLNMSEHIVLYFWHKISTHIVFSSNIYIVILPTRYAIVTFLPIGMNPHNNCEKECYQHVPSILI